jgi:hypothetical protein
MVWRLLHFCRHCSKKKSKLFGFGFFLRILKLIDFSRLHL